SHTEFSKDTSMKFKGVELKRALVQLVLAGFFVCAVGLVSITRGQSICIAPKLKVTRMVGQVVFPSTNGKEPIAGAVIEMSEDNDDGRTIERATTDESGHFAFNNIKAGKYKLIATAPHPYAS